MREPNMQNMPQAKTATAQKLIEAFYKAYPHLKPFTRFTGDFKATEVAFGRKFKFARSGKE